MTDTFDMPQIILTITTTTFHLTQPGLARQGITEPSPIQKNAIQQIISGANVAIQSYTGSGKVGSAAHAERGVVLSSLSRLL
jgi:Lhr-like helicase